MRRRNTAAGGDAGGDDGARAGVQDDDAADEKKKQKMQRAIGSPSSSSSLSLPTLHPFVALTWVACLVLIARWSVLFNVPAPLGLHADASLFAEDRAMTHAFELAENIGVRVVGTANVQVAERYVAAEARELVRVAKRTRGDDLDVDFMLHRPSGSFRLNFLNNDIANAYTNLTNIAVRVAPKGMGLVKRRRSSSTTTQTAGGENGGGGDDDGDDDDDDIEVDASVKAVLINGHFDTTLGSPGAADCASCVGIMLEVLRALIHNQPKDAKGDDDADETRQRQLTSPVVFLFNGGEETFMQAAHGFVAHHPWSPSVGVVINVEATGTGGPDVLFREAGGWPAPTYMRAAPHPTATATIRDLVRFANLPVDTDFSVFADPTEPHGNLPGVDIASMLDGYSYHTKEDLPGRIRRGTIQAYGENVMAATLAFADELAVRGGGGGGGAAEEQDQEQEEQGEEQQEEQQGEDGEKRRRRREPVAAGTGAGFFDVYGAKGVVYGPRWVAASLHVLPLALCILDISSGGGGGGKSGSYLRGARVAASSWGYAVALPAVLGASRAVLFGRPLVWFGKPLVTLALYLPPTLVAVALPYGKATFAPATAATAATTTTASRMDGARGAALVTALAAAVVGSVGGAIGYLPALWSMGVLAALHLPPPLGGGGGGGGLGCLVCTAPAAALSAPVAYVTFVLLSEKVGIAGSEPWPLGLPIGDAIMGAMTGFLTSLSFAGILPFVAAGAPGSKASRRFARRGILLAALVWIVTAVVSSAAYPTPYSLHAPKRLAVLHQHDANAGADNADKPSSSSSSSSASYSAPSVESLFLVGAFDSVPAANALPPLHRNAVMRPTTREDFGSFHPVTQLLGEGVVLPARPAAHPPWGASPPTLSVNIIERRASQQEVQGRGRGGGQERRGVDVVRIGVTFDIRAPAWSCARVTSRDGPVLAWSLSSTLPGSPRSAGTTGTGTGTGTDSGTKKTRNIFPTGTKGTKGTAGTGTPWGAKQAQAQALWARHAGNGDDSRVWTFWVEVEAGREKGLRVDAWALYPEDSVELDTVVGSLGHHISPIVGTSYRVKAATL